MAEKIIFFGTPDFAAKILETLGKAGLFPKLIVTGPDEPKGRGQKLKPPPVKEWALKYNIPYEQPVSAKALSELKEKIKKIKPDIFIVASYGKIIPEALLSVPKKGALNIHPSLLPKYRGPSPIQTAILEGDKKTGVSIMLLDEEMDHGPVLAQEEVDIEEKETYESLYDKLARIGGKLILKTMPLWIQGKIEPKEQIHSKAVYTKILKREDGRINWNQPADRIERMIRAFQPWPGAFSFFAPSETKLLAGFQENSGKKRIYFLEARAMEGSSAREPGAAFPFEKTFAIQAKNSALKIERAKLEGRKEMAAEDLLRGHPKIKNSKFF